MNGSFAHAAPNYRQVMVGMFSVAVFLTGLGFASAFGWLWFPVLRDILLPGLSMEGPSFHPLAFGMALGAGSLLYGYMGSFARTLRGQYLNAILAHMLSVALLGLSVMERSEGVVSSGLSEGIFHSLPDVLADALAGLAASLPGVWWFSRLLGMGPVRSVAALAIAALVALLFSLPLSQRMDGASGWMPVMAVAALSIGLAIGFSLALFLLWRQNRKFSASTPLPPSEMQAFKAKGNAVHPVTSPTTDGVASLAPALSAAALSFFGLGSLNVFFIGSGTFFPTITHMCGLFLAVFVLGGLSGDRRRHFPAYETGVAKESPVGGQQWLGAQRCLLMGACGLATLSVFPPLFPQVSGVLFPLAATLPEAAGLALCAALSGTTSKPGESGDPAAFMRGSLVLVVMLIAVNAGHLAGMALADEVGVAAPALPGMAAALLLGVDACRASKCTRIFSVGMTGGAYRPEETPVEETSLDVKGNGRTGNSKEETSRQKTAQLRPTVELTEKERALALLLIQGYSNKEICNALALSENTVRWYIKKLNKKTGASDRPGLIASLQGE